VPKYFVCKICDDLVPEYDLREHLREHHPATGSMDATEVRSQYVYDQRRNELNAMRRLLEQDPDAKRVRVFLGGTCNGSKWRDDLIKMLDTENLSYFNPVVDDWTPECQKEEIRQREEVCNYYLYVLTSKMTGVYAVAELVEDAVQNPDHTIFCFLCVDEKDTFTTGQIKSMQAVASLVRKRGAAVCESLHGVAKMLNERAQEIPLYGTTE